MFLHVEEEPFRVPGVLEEVHPGVGDRSGSLAEAPGEVVHGVEDPDGEVLDGVTLGEVVAAAHKPSTLSSLDFLLHFKRLPDPDW